MSALAEDAAARCRAGLGRALRALVDDAVEQTAAALHRPDHATPALPWLPGLVYRALAPLGVAFDEQDRLAVAAGAALIGRPVPAARLRTALEGLPAAPPAASAPDPELAEAIEAFWQRLAEVAAELGRAWRAGDPDRAHGVASAAVPELWALAAAVAEARGEIHPDPPDAPPETVGSESATAAGSESATEAGSESATAAGPESATEAGPGDHPEEPLLAPVLELDDAPVPPDRPQSALAFALLALTIALLVLLAVLGGFPTG